MREYEGSAAQNWSIAVFSLPEWIFKFALNTVMDTLPHNVNVCKWKKLFLPHCQLCGEPNLWPTSSTPARKPSHWAATLLGMTACSRSSLTSCSATWQLGFRSLLTYQASSTPSRKTLPPRTCAQTLSCGALQPFTWWS